MKCFGATWLFTLAEVHALAGGVFCSSNQSAEYIRTFERNSAIDNADIVHYNMAGTVRLRPGLTFNLSNQTILQWATVRTVGNPALGGRHYESRNPAWLVPDLYLAYRRGRWAGFTGLETMGATAVRRWPDGLPTLDLAAKQAAGYGGAASSLIGADAYGAALQAGAGPARAQAAGVAAALDSGPFASRSWLKGSSCFLAWRAGAAFRISPRAALAVAGRLVYSRQDFTGGATGTCTYDQDGHDLRGTATTLVDVSAKAAGCSLELGLDLYPAEGVVLNLTWEQATGLEFRTAVRDGKDGGGWFTDGRRSSLDLPQVWRFGLGCQLTPALRASLGFCAYLEHGARMTLLDNPAAGIDARRDYRDTFEEAAALECQVDPRWLVSVGINVNQIGQARSATLDTSLPGAHADYLALGAGCQWQRSERVRINFGLAVTGFGHRYQQADALADQPLQARFAAMGQAIDPRKEYDKRYLILALGVDCHLPR